VASSRHAAPRLVSRYNTFAKAFLAFFRAALPLALDDLIMMASELLMRI